MDAELIIENIFELVFGYFGIDYEGFDPRRELKRGGGGGRGKGSGKSGDSSSDGGAAGSGGLGEHGSRSFLFSKEMGYFFLSMLGAWAFYHSFNTLVKAFKKWYKVDFDGYLAWSMARISNNYMCVASND